MKRLNHLSENTFLKLFFAYFSLCFLVAAFFMPDRDQMLPGFWRILSSPTKASTNFFSIGGYAATFLNMGLVGLICTGLYCIPGEKANHAATLVCILMLPVLEHHYKTKQERLEARQADAFLFE